MVLLRTTYQPSRANPSTTAPSSSSPPRVSRTARRQASARPGSVVRSASTSDGQADQYGVPGQLTELRAAVRRGGQPHPGTGREQVRGPRGRRVAGAGAYRPVGQQRPLHHQPVALVAGVEPVGHRTVELGDVVPGVGGELGQVEVRVARHQRIVGPADPVHATPQCPGPLVQFEGEPDLAAAPGRRHPGDVRVQFPVGHPGAEHTAGAGSSAAGRTEEADAGADQFAVTVRGAHIVAGVRQRPQHHRGQVGVVRVLLPHLGEQRTHRSEPGRVGGLTHHHPRRVRCGCRNRVGVDPGRLQRHDAGRSVAHPPILPRSVARRVTGRYGAVIGSLRYERLTPCPGAGETVCPFYGVTGDSPADRRQVAVAPEERAAAVRQRWPDRQPGVGHRRRTTRCRGRTVPCGW